MKNFNDIEYERIDYEKTEEIVKELIQKLENTNDFDLYYQLNVLNNAEKVKLLNEIKGSD